MKTFILCGGFGTRIDHEGKLKAKPMVRIGHKPILMHIVENYIKQGYNDFVFCLGHKSNTIINYFLKENKKNITILEKKKNLIKFFFILNKNKFTGNLIYTGLNTGTGGRIKKAYKKLKLDEDIMLTYGDGLSNVSIKKLIKFHYKNRSEVTMTAVRPKQRYGVLKLNKNKVKFFDNNTYWEIEPLKYFLRQKKLYAFKHEGFWKSLDTLKDKNDFNQMFQKNKKPWIV